MSRLTKQAEFLTDWERMLDALEQNADDFPDLQWARLRLQSMVEGVRAAGQGQVTHAASKQTASQEIKAIFNAGRKLVTVMRTVIRERYGNRSEKLAEFRLQPFRSRTQPPKITSPEIPSPPPEAVP